MPLLPSRPTDERLFLKNIRNHAEFRRNLDELAMRTDLPILDGKILAVAKCWFRLAEEHLLDAMTAQGANRPRAMYSRAYYAAYNASKAIRYQVSGIVSLKGDDHQKASELPDDFPNVDVWSKTVTLLYEHRLRADYDNWTETTAEHTLSPTDCINRAEQFLQECRGYLSNKFGVTM